MRRRKPARSRAFLRLAIALLAIMVSVGAAMPAYARLLAGPRAHTCHCETRGGHAHCACPLCFTELRAQHDDDDDEPGMGTVKSSCGDDDPGWRTISDPALPASSLVTITPRVVVIPPFVPDVSPETWRSAPDPRPPRA